MHGSRRLGAFRSWLSAPAKLSKALAQQGNELTALGVEVAELIVPAEREILESLRQLAARSGAQKRKSPDDD